MSVRLIVREAAQEDIREAVEWYDRQSPGLGAEFVRCVDACRSLISRHPEMFRQVHRKARMALMRRFPRTSDSLAMRRSRLRPVTGSLGIVSLGEMKTQRYLIVVLATIREEDARHHLAGERKHVHQLRERAQRPRRQHWPHVLTPSGAVVIPEMVDSSPASGSQLGQQKFLPRPLVRSGPVDIRHRCGFAEIIHQCIA